MENNKKRKEERVERRRSGKGCWNGEAVEEVRAVEGEGDEEELMGEGVLTMLDEDELAAV